MDTTAAMVTWLMYLVLAPLNLTSLQFRDNGVLSWIQWPGALTMNIVIRLLIDWLSVNRSTFLWCDQQKNAWATWLLKMSTWLTGWFGYTIYGTICLDYCLPLRQMGYMSGSILVILVRGNESPHSVWGIEISFNTYIHTYIQCIITARIMLTLSLVVIPWGYIHSNSLTKNSMSLHFSALVSK